MEIKEKLAYGTIPEKGNPTWPGLSWNELLKQIIKWDKFGTSAQYERDENSWVDKEMF